MRITVGLVLLIIAVLLFVLAAFMPVEINLVALGLAFLAGAFAADRLMPGTT